MKLLLTSFYNNNHITFSSNNTNENYVLRPSVSLASLIFEVRTKYQFKMSEEKIARPMKFPYTFSAKLAQFPYKHYFQNQWIWKYYAISVVLCTPVFYKIHKLSNSPENVAKWAESKRKEKAAHH